MLFMVFDMLFNAGFISFGSHVVCLSLFVHDAASRDVPDCKLSSSKLPDKSAHVHDLAQYIFE